MSDINNKPRLLHIIIAGLAGVIVFIALYLLSVIIAQKILHKIGPAFMGVIVGLVAISTIVYKWVIRILNRRGHIQPITREGAQNSEGLVKHEDNSQCAQDTTQSLEVVIQEKSSTNSALKKAALIVYGLWFLGWLLFMLLFNTVIAPDSVDYDICLTSFFKVNVLPFLINAVGLPLLVALFWYALKKLSEVKTK